MPGQKQRRIALEERIGAGRNDVAEQKKRRKEQRRQDEMNAISRLALICVEKVRRDQSRLRSFSAAFVTLLRNCDVATSFPFSIAEASAP